MIMIIIRLTACFGYVDNSLCIFLLRRRGFLLLRSALGRGRRAGSGTRSGVRGTGARAGVRGMSSFLLAFL